MHTDNTLPEFIIAIPSRYGSTRLPGKPLVNLGGRPLIARVVERALEAGASKVVVAVDDERIAYILEDMDSSIEICMTRPDHLSGSDRLAECANIQNWNDDTIVVNLQGDEPFAPVTGIQQVVKTLVKHDAPMSTLYARMTNIDNVLDPNVVKVVTDAQGQALYFSRAPIPWMLEGFVLEATNELRTDIVLKRHVGIYAYRAGFLRRFTKLAPTMMEKAESLEQLRALEYGYRISASMTPEAFPPGIDTQEDLDNARALYAQ